MKLVARTLLVLSAFFSFAMASAGELPPETMVRLQTNVGRLDFQLLDNEAPVTVANFLAYVRGGDYQDVFFHRDAWNSVGTPTPFVIQTGAYQWPDSGCCSSVISRGQIVNEFSPTRSNVRGTVAMAKVDSSVPGGGPNSATSQWFINMSNNAANLDNQNGGFTVFARVTAPGMTVADQISNLPRYTVQNTPFTEIPLLQAAFNRSTVVRVLATGELPNINPSDKIFNYLEASYPQYVDAFPALAGDGLGFIFRFYAATNSYLGTKDGHVWFYAPNLLTDLIDLGTTDFWLSTATSAGY